MSKKKSYEQLNKTLSLCKTQRFPLLYTGIVTALFLFLCFGALLCLTVDTNTPLSQGQVVTSDNMTDMLDRLSGDSSASADSHYQVVMSTNWTFLTGDSASSDSYVENSADNTNTMYFTVTLPDRELPIYTSSYLPVDSHIDNIRLDENLPAGTYDAVITYYLLDEYGACVGTIPMRLKIIIRR